MKYESIENKYGGKMAKKIVEKMEGQTVGVNKDGTLDYYDYDVENAYKNILISKTNDDCDIEDKFKNSISDLKLGKVKRVA